MVASLVGTRLTPQVERDRDFGERVVGSNNNIEQISAPFNLFNMPAIARFAVTGDAFDLTSDSSPTLTLPSAGALRDGELRNVELNSPKVAFRPTHKGEAIGTLKITVSWPIDGHVETQTIALRGRAREFDQAPADFAPTLANRSATDDAEKPTAASSRPDATRRHDPEQDEFVTKKELQNKDEVDTAIRTTASAARKLARSQRDGLKIIDDEASSYGKEIPKVARSRWWDLAEMALNLATGNLAGMFASKLLPRLLQKTVVEDIPWVGEVSSTITPKLSEAVTGSIKSAMILAGQKAVKAALPSDGPTTAQAGTQAGAAGGKHSSNARIDFFADQTAVLDDQEDEYEALVDAHARQVKPLALDHPKQAVEALAIVTDQFKKMKHDAEQAQADATAPAWATLIARLGLGQDVVTTAQTPETVHQATKMDSLRSTDRRGAPARAANGVLDVYVSSNKVVAAKLNGVAQEVADRLADMPLSQAPMPIRFIMGRPGEPQPVIITRDETGRVRTKGDPNTGMSDGDEARLSADLIERILTLPLSSTGVEIQTDDATGRGP